MKFEKISKSLKKTIKILLTLLYRPFYDFYYNYGLSKAAVLAYVLCANLILIVYIVLTFGLITAINPFQTTNSLKRFLEVHFLWPIPNQLYHLKSAPEPLYELLPPKKILTHQELQLAQKQYLQKYHSPPNIQTEKISPTYIIAQSLHHTIEAFNKSRDQIPSLGILTFTLFALSYIILLMSFTTALAEVDSPVIGGNLPIQQRSSSLERLLWYLPTWNSLKQYSRLFVELPVLAAILIALLTWGQFQIDQLIPQDTNLLANTIIAISISFLLTTTLFWIFYTFSVHTISKRNLLLGAITAAALWMGGRYLLSYYTITSLTLSLRTFALLPILITWLYYFCAVFLLGAHIAHTFEYPYLNTTTRSWIRKEVLQHPHFTKTALWIRLHFLLLLAKDFYNSQEKFISQFQQEASKQQTIQNLNELSPKAQTTFLQKFYHSPQHVIHSNCHISIHKKQPKDTANQIALQCRMHPSFVREVLSDMISHHLKTKPKIFVVENHRKKKQICYLATHPKNIHCLLVAYDPIEDQKYLEEDVLENHPFGHFLQKQFLPPQTTLEELYQQISSNENFLPKQKKIPQFLQGTNEDEILFPQLPLTPSTKPNETNLPPLNTTHTPPPNPASNQHSPPKQE